jgi:hypothetical protein
MYFFTTEAAAMRMREHLVNAAREMRHLDELVGKCVLDALAVAGRLSELVEIAVVGDEWIVGLFRGKRGLSRRACSIRCDQSRSHRSEVNDIHAGKWTRPTGPDSRAEPWLQYPIGNI